MTTHGSDSIYDTAPAVDWSYDAVQEDGDPPHGASPPPPADQGRGWWRIGLVTGMAGLLVGVGIGAVAFHRNSPASRPTPTTTAGGVTSPSPASSGDLDVKGVLAKVEPAVVSIVSNVSARGGRRGQAAGTGMILTGDGKVLTNAHVIDGATSIQVVTKSNGTHAATVLGADTADDVAVIQIQGVSALPTVALGNSGGLQVGDPLVAVGNALALDGGLTVTTGIVSALNRQIDSDNGPLSGLIQTDAPINPGNSGGPLLNGSGQVVGMNTAVAGGAQNIGFAIAVDRIKLLIADLESGKRTTGASSTAYLGVSSEDTGQGAGIVAVGPGSPADQAGLTAGQVILAVDSTPVRSASDLVSVIRAHKAGDRVQIQIRGASKKVAVTLGTRPA